MNVPVSLHLYESLWPLSAFKIFDLLSLGYPDLLPRSSSFFDVMQPHIYGLKKQQTSQVFRDC